MRHRFAVIRLIILCAIACICSRVAFGQSLPPGFEKADLSKPEIQKKLQDYLQSPEGKAWVKKLEAANLKLLTDAANRHFKEATAAETGEFAEYNSVTAPPIGLLPDYVPLWEAQINQMCPPRPQSRTAGPGGDQSVSSQNSVASARPTAPLGFPDIGQIEAGIDQIRRHPDEVRKQLVSVRSKFGFEGPVAYTDKYVAWLDSLYLVLHKERGFSDFCPAIDAERGRCAIGRGQFEAASSYLANALTSDPNLAQAHQALGDLYRIRGNTDRAEAEYRRTVELSHDGDVNDAARIAALVGLSECLLNARDNKGAMTAAEQALADSIKSKALDQELISSIAKGFVLCAEQDYPTAVKLFQSAISRVNSINDGRVISLALLGLMRCSVASGHVGAASLYGKLAFSGLETDWIDPNLINGGLGDPKLVDENAPVSHQEAIRRHLILRTRTAEFRILVDALIHQKRLAEAIDIIDFFKEEDSIDNNSAATRPRLEYADQLGPFWNDLRPLYARYFSKSSPLPGPERIRLRTEIEASKNRLATFLLMKAVAAEQPAAGQAPAPIHVPDGGPKHIALSTSEVEAKLQLQKMWASAQIRSSSGTEFQRALDRYAPDSPVGQALRQSLPAVGREDWVRLINSWNNAPNVVPDGAADDAAVQRMQTTLRITGHNSAAVYVVAGGRQLDLILITKDTAKSYSTIVDELKLNAEADGFTEALRNPMRDPRMAGQKLYNLLAAPLEADLQSARITTIMWSLDGRLRYIPVGALWDGKRYLVEKYASAEFTPASNSRLQRGAEPKWTVLGLGTTRTHGAFPALPGVRAELNSIVRSPERVGILDGTSLFDDEFTEQALLESLRKGYQVVHIASHFVLAPGDPDRSGILLGNGSLLSLTALNQLPENLLANVRLLCLSACSTAADSNTSGRDLENVAALAQHKGAEAILASLWPLNDASTSVIMPLFYRLRRSATKAEALREAQLALLRGTVLETEEQAKLRARGAKLVSGSRPGGGKEFIADPKAPLSHPYYWAPFVLFGNWL